jgi:subfamily B ATP-binding cassette protein MsbA
VKTPTTLRRLLAYFRPYRGRAAAALVAMGIVSLSTVLLLYLLTKIIDDVLGTGASAALPGLGAAPEKAAGFVRWLDSIYAGSRRASGAAGIPVRLAVPLLLLLALVSKNVFSYFSEFAFNGIGLSMVRDLRRDAYAKLLGQSASFYSRSTTGDLLSRLLSDVELIQSAFGTRLADFVQGAVTIVLVLFYVVSLNAKLSLFVLLLAPVLLLPIVEVTRRLRRTTFSSRERIGEMGALLSETLRGHRVIKTYGMEPFEADRFARANDRYFRVTRRTVRIQALNSPMMEVIAGIGLSAIFVYAAGVIRAGGMSVGGLISFLAALMMLYKPLKDVTKVNMALQLALSSARRIFELIDAPAEITEKPGAQALAPFANAIRYENVSFRYGNEEVVLTDIDLTIRRGETVAIVGPSGAGKTTLVNLLPRLYDPTRGRITFDGVDLKDASLASLRGQIGIVTQDTVLFDTTARENVAYGRPGASEGEIRAAARAAFADEFLERLPEGYDTRLGEDAGRLSGGQKQRLAIARALFKDAPILILDEATSQLDSESEALVASALTNLMEGRTTLVIAHRLSTVRRADRILVLDRGRLVESGTHAELLTRNGLYRRLHDMQYFVETEVPAEARS